MLLKSQPRTRLGILCGEACAVFYMLWSGLEGPLLGPITVGEALFWHNDDRDEVLRTGALARAEWIKFLGTFFNLDAEATAYFTGVEQKYNAIKVLP